VFVCVCVCVCGVVTGVCVCVYSTCTYEQSRPKCVFKHAFRSGLLISSIHELMYVFMSGSVRHFRTWREAKKRKEV
jgi:hypothetical protein